jgi:hypothetical protein
MHSESEEFHLSVLTVQSQVWVSVHSARYRKADDSRLSQAGLNITRSEVKVDITHMSMAQVRKPLPFTHHIPSIRRRNE